MGQLIRDGRYYEAMSIVGTLERASKMDDRHQAVRVYCNSCRGETNHHVREVLIKTGRESYPEVELASLKRSVESFFDLQLNWPDPSSCWQWLFEVPERIPEEDEEGIISDLDSWLDSDGNLQQDLWFEDFTTWILARQGWRWLEILQACMNGFESEERWEIVECRGCNTLAFRLARWSEKDDIRDPRSGQLIEHKVNAERFPLARTTDEPVWIIPSWIELLPTEIRKRLEDIYKALNEDLHSLASMGLRSLFELVMIDYVGEQRGFNKMLQRLLQDGLISKLDLPTFEAAIESGHAAIHRRHYPTVEEVRTVVDVIEMFLYRLFVMPKQIEFLERRTPRDSRKRNTESKVADERK